MKIMKNNEETMEDNEQWRKIEENQWKNSEI
jgi:hypothetical protein